MILLAAIAVALVFVLPSSGQAANPQFCAQVVKARRSRSRSRLRTAPDRT
jgi:hypothetical protein